MHGRPSSLPEAEHVRRSFGSERIDRYDVLLILIEVSKSTVHKELNDLCHTQSKTIRAATRLAISTPSEPSALRRAVRSCTLMLHAVHGMRPNLQLCGERRPAAARQLCKQIAETVQQVQTRRRGRVEPRERKCTIGNQRCDLLNIEKPRLG